MIEEVKDKLKLILKNDDIFMYPIFSDFCNTMVRRSRGTIEDNKRAEYDPVVVEVNNMKLKFAKQLFINGQFVDSESGNTLECINPADESVICSVRYENKYNFLMYLKLKVWFSRCN